MPTLTGLNANIGPDDRVRRANEAALAATAVKRAARDREHATINSAMQRARDLSDEIRGVEIAEFNRIMGNP